MDAPALLLTAAFRHTITEPNIEAGFARFASLVGQPVGFEAFCNAVGVCKCDGLVREPIRLLEGSPQCHWHVELTPERVTAAGALLSM